jgi:hypothetical protein
MTRQAGKEEIYKLITECKTLKDLILNKKITENLMSLTRSVK